MTKSAIEKEAARIHQNTNCNCEMFEYTAHVGAIEKALRSVYNAAIEEAAVAVETEHEVCLPLMCESARKVRALKIGDDK